MPKKDLGQIAMTYGNIFVASISIGANDSQALKAFVEAEAYDGPSLIIAYSHCIAHGINMTTGLEDQKAAVACGYWPLYRYNPDLAEQGKNPFQYDSAGDPKMTFKDYAYRQNRFKMLTKSKPEEAARLIELSQKDMDARRRVYAALAARSVIAGSALPGHHPDQLVDPAGLEHWLDHLDPETSTVPEWALP